MNLVVSVLGFDFFDFFLNLRLAHCEYFALKVSQKTHFKQNRSNLKYYQLWVITFRIMRLYPFDGGLRPFNQEPFQRTQLKTVIIKVKTFWGEPANLYASFFVQIMQGLGI
jgi:hypothetical protein